LLDDADLIHGLLKEKDAAREISFKKVRQLIRTCGDGIRCLHRGDFSGAEKRAENARALMADTAEELSAHPDLSHSPSTRAGQMEYAELMAVSRLLTEKRVPTMAEVGVPPAPYLSGLGDTVGEIRRHILNLLRRGETGEAEEYLEISESIYDVLMGFDYPKAITGELRHKQDVARSLIERTRADVTNAVLQKDLSRKLEEAKGD
jgi:translin